MYGEGYGGESGSDTRDCCFCPLCETKSALTDFHQCIQVHFHNVLNLQNIVYVF